MEPCKVVFDLLAWQEAMLGARFKVFGGGGSSCAFSNSPPSLLSRTGAKKGISVLS